MGQILSLPMFVAGVWLIVRARPHPTVIAKAVEQSR
jgi:prolipoprotein diacylglyceryltransferase